jgi:hypothetical protein
LEEGLFLIFIVAAAFTNMNNYVLLAQKQQSTYNATGNQSALSNLKVNISKASLHVYLFFL